MVVMARSDSETYKLETVVECTADIMIRLPSTSAICNPLMLNSVWNSALMKLPRLYDMNNCVSFSTFRVANIKSFFMWKSCTFSINKLNFFGSFLMSVDAFMKITVDVSAKKKSKIFFNLKALRN